MAELWRPGEPPPAPLADRLWLTALIAVVMLVAAGMTVREVACIGNGRCTAPPERTEEWRPAGEWVPAGELLPASEFGPAGR
jgi:hypothetical protein